MSSSLRFGLILGGILAAIPLIYFSLGLEKDETIQNVTTFINIIIIAIIVYLGIKDQRDNKMNGFISFGKAFSTGMGISAISGIISAIFSYLYFAVINPGMVTYIRMMQEQKLIEKGMSDSEVAKMAEKMAMFTTPPMMAAFSFVGLIIIGLVISLVCGGILKKEDPSAQIS